MARKLIEDNTPEQRMLFARIQKAGDSLANARRVAEEEARQIVKERLATVRAVRDAAVMEAYQLYKSTENNPTPKGLSISSIKRALRTKDYRTVADIISALEFDETPTETPMFTVDRETNVVTWNWLEWETEIVQGTLVTQASKHGNGWSLNWKVDNTNPLDLLINKSPDLYAQMNEFVTDYMKNNH